MWVLDTNVAIHLRDGDEDIETKFSALGGSAAISVVTLVELEGGVYRDPTQTVRLRPRLDAMLEAMDILVFERREAGIYGEIVATLGYSRSRILDRMIAAQAIAADATLITINGADFKGIPGLKLEIWSSPPPLA